MRDLLLHLRQAPDYFDALKAAASVFISALPIYAGLRYFLYRRRIKTSLALPAAFFGVFLLFSGLAFIFASPLAGILQGIALTSYLFVTSLLAACCIVLLVDLFVVQHYLTQVAKVYISPPLRTVISLSVFVAALLPILRFVLNFNPLTLVAIPTILTAGVALALQDTLKTFVAGVSLGKIVRLGEWIVFQDKEGEVVDVNWARTVLRTLDGNRVFIPNSQLQTGVFLNYTTGHPANRMALKVGIAYDAAPARVKEVIRQCAEGVPGVAAAPPPAAVLSEYGDSAIIYGLYYWVDDYGRRQAIQDEVATRLWYALKRAGIEIPFPIRTVRIQRRPASGEEAPDEGVAKALAQWALAEAFGFEELRELARWSRPRVYMDGERIVRQGEAGHSLFVILDGRVEIVVDGGSGHPVADLGPHEIFGEMSLLTGAPRSATARAKGPVEALEVEKAGLQKILARRPELGDRLAELVVARQKALAGAARPGPESSPSPSNVSTLAGRIREFFGL